MIKIKDIEPGMAIEGYGLIQRVTRPDELEVFGNTWALTYFDFHDAYYGPNTQTFTKKDADELEFYIECEFGDQRYTDLCVRLFQDVTNALDHSRANQSWLHALSWPNDIGQEELQLTPRQAADKISYYRSRIAEFNSEIDSLAKKHIPEFNFMDHKVSTFWTCDESPIGICVWDTSLNGFNIDCACHYCGQPVERK